MCTPFRKSNAPVSECYHGKARRLEQDYAVCGQIIGSGISGEVRVAISLAQPTQKFAVKSIKRASVLSYLCGTGDDRTDPLSEIKNHAGVEHSHIVKLHDVYETKHHFHLVMDCLEGGDLCTKLEEKGKFSEVEASKAIQQILLALDHLHKQGIAHRDVKLDNLMYDKKEGEELKLVDFGLSSSKGQMNECVGTSAYVAPEVLKCANGRKCSYTSQCDMWSLGALSFMLLTDELPFSGEAETRKGKITAKPESWHSISAEGKDFIESLLQINPSKRLTAEQALKHAWMPRCQDNDTALVNVENDSSKGSANSDETATGNNSSHESTNSSNWQPVFSL